MRPDIRILQKVVRVCTDVPLVKRLAWEVAPSIRRYYGSYFNGKQVLTEYDRGIKIWVNPSKYVGSNIFWQGIEQEDRGMVKLLKQLLEPDQVFFDVGANIGVITLIAADRLTEGEVHAFEPLSHHLEMLNLNLRTNSYDNVMVNPFGLSDENGTSQLHVPREKVNNLQNTGMATMFSRDDGNVREELENECETECIQLRTLDDYVTEREVSRLDLMKIDVEGGEPGVLRGGKQTIRRFRPKVIMELNRDHLSRAEETVAAVLRFWKQHEYYVYKIGYGAELTRRKSPDQFGRHQNVFCCPASFAREERIE